MKKIYQYSRAFTLIELLVVIAIVVLLTAIILTNVTSSRSKARDAKRISDIGQVQLSLELFFDRCKQYPVPGGSGQLPLLTASNNCPAGVTFKNYISQVPQPPPGTTYDYSVNNSSAPTDYVLHVTLENENDLIKDGIWDSNKPSYVTTFSCYTSTDHKKDYCLGPK